MGMRCCPECKEVVNPLKLIAVTRFTPYICPKCGSKFRRVLLPMLLVYPGMAILCETLLHVFTSDGAFVCILVCAIVITVLLDWLVMPWRNISTNSARQTTCDSR
jgi:hypothetical protein